MTIKGKKPLKKTKTEGRGRTRGGSRRGPNLYAGPIDPFTGPILTDVEEYMSLPS